MRNNQHNESNGRIEPQLDTSAAQHAERLESNPTAAHTTQRSSGRAAIGFFSVLTIAVACSAAAFGWWSFERMQLLEQQLIATQDSFSKVSEEASGRINAITGKVSAAENSVLSGTDALKVRLNTLEQSIVDTQKKQQSTLTGNTSQLTLLTSEFASLTDRHSSLNDKLNEQEKVFSSALTTQHNELSTKLDSKVTTLNSELKQTLNDAITSQKSTLAKRIDAQDTKLRDLEQSIATSQQQLAKFDDINNRLQSIKADLATLQKGTKTESPSQGDFTRLQQDILILRTELDNRPTPAATPARHTGPSIADFDAYRAQTNRTISALQEQVRNLQKNSR